MVNWSEVGVAVGAVGVVQVPVILMFTAAYRWVRDVDERLDRIESRSHERRKDDPPGHGPGSRPVGD
jgi:hypothetical protein